MTLVGWRGTASLRAYTDTNDTVHLLRLFGADLSKYGKLKTMVSNWLCFHNLFLFAFSVVNKFQKKQEEADAAADAAAAAAAAGEAEAIEADTDELISTDDIVADNQLEEGLTNDAE